MIARPQSDVPAPVITHEGTYGTPPPFFRTPLRGRHDEARAWLGLTYICALAAWLVAFSVAQLTSPTVGLPVAAHIVDAVAEVDTWVAMHASRLCSTAPNAPIDLDGFPVPDLVIRGADVPCPGGSLDRQRFRDLLRARAAERVYLRGTDAFVEDGRTPQAASPISAVGIARMFIDASGATTNDWVTLPAYALGALSVALGAAMLLAGKDRLRRLGAATLLAALPIGLGALALHFALGAVRPDAATSPLMHELIGLAASLAWLPAHNAAIVGAAGLLLTFPALFSRRAE